MRRRLLGWLLSLPLVAAGGLGAHGLAYRLVAPADGHAHGPADEAHGYLAHWPLCVAVCAALVLAGVGWHALQSVQAGSRVRLPVWLFGLLPPLGFTVQEHVERLLTAGGFPTDVVLQPVFLVGLLLQAPFALAVFLLARALLTVAVSLAQRLARRRRPRLAPAPPSWRPVRTTALPRILPLALGHGQRGPPVLVSI